MSIPLLPDEAALIVVTGAVCRVSEADDAQALKQRYADRAEGTTAAEAGAPGRAIEMSSPW
ncbi:hypothetical protein P3H15_36405 [Rhodococcus sp. T2V]|uniref:hypothetical protein n=1 Tax=Rhodococcus sp. T2V TaxID=3034164 RepID=UPI0023E25087|nr:hypothetical protein [Rhodococcus sp. T2V]MDF3310502.1 hypothetical protein [Rhodococcus sp. T2V]